MTQSAEHLLLGFPQCLRNAGVDTQPLHIQDYLRAVRALPLRSIDDLYRAGRITLISRPEDFAAYDDVFEAWFCKDAQTVFELEEEDKNRLNENPPDTSEFAEQNMQMSEAKGELASSTELLGKRVIEPPSQDELLRLARFGRNAHRYLPKIKSRRRKPALKGKRIDLRRTMKDARRHYGEPFTLHYTIAPDMIRSVVILIDISGSMKGYTNAILRLSHTLVHVSNRVEVFCFGTRLTRITQKLRHKDVDTAMANLSDSVLDFDGGTRIGPSILRLLENSRFISSIRGAVTLVMSDGLERGDTQAMQKAVTRLSQLSHRMIWLNPLAADPAYRPVTRGMKAILPSLDAIENAATLAALIEALQKLQSLELKPRGLAARQYDLT